MIPEFKKILFATDLSENAQYAFSYAISLAERYAAELTVIHVLEGLSLSSESLVINIIGLEKWRDLRKKNEQKIINTIGNRIKDYCEKENKKNPACRIQPENIIVKVGHPAVEIVHLAEVGHFDVVVLGARGLGLLADAVLGSVSRRVLRRCVKPVLVVRLP